MTNFKFYVGYMYSVHPNPLSFEENSNHLFSPVLSELQHKYNVNPHYWNDMITHWAIYMYIISQSVLSYGFSLESAH